MRRTVDIDVDTAWKLLRTLLDRDESVRGIRSETSGRVLRASYQPDEWSEPSTLQLRVLPAATGTTLAVHHEHLPSAVARETMRRQWTDALEQLIAGPS